MRVPLRPLGDTDEWVCEPLVRTLTPQLWSTGLTSPAPRNCKKSEPWSSSPDLPNQNLHFNRTFRSFKFEKHFLKRWQILSSAYQTAISSLLCLIRPQFCIWQSECGHLAHFKKKIKQIIIFAKFLYKFSLLAKASPGKMSAIHVGKQNVQLGRRKHELFWLPESLGWGYQSACSLMGTELHVYNVPEVPDGASACLLSLALQNTNDLPEVGGHCGMWTRL